MRKHITDGMMIGEGGTNSKTTGCQLVSHMQISMRMPGELRCQASLQKHLYLNQTIPHCYFVLKNKQKKHYQKQNIQNKTDKNKNIYQSLANSFISCYLCQCNFKLVLNLLATIN